MALTPKPTPPNGARLLAVVGKENDFILFNYLIKQFLDDGWHNYADFTKVQSTGQIVTGTDGKKWLKADGYTKVFTGNVYLEDRDVTWYDLPTELIPVPNAPINLSVSIVSSTELSLMWTNPGGANVEVERSISLEGPFTKITSTGTNATGYNDRNRTANTEYYYRIRAVNESGPSPYSEITGIRTPETPAPLPPAPVADQTSTPAPPVYAPPVITPNRNAEELDKLRAAATVPAPKSWLETNLTMVLAGVGLLVLVVMVAIAKRD